MKVLKTIGLAMLAWPLISCGGGGGDGQIAPPPVASVTVSPQTPQVVIGNSLQMSAVARNASGGTVSGVTFSWISDDTSKATVSATGMVTGVGEGTVRISATVGTHMGASMLTVMPLPTPAPAAVNRVVIEPASAMLMEGATQQFSVKVYDAQDKLLLGRGVQWSTLDNQIAVVDGGGNTTALRVGVTTINVRVEGKTASAGLRVETDYPFELVFERRADDGTTGLYTLDISDPAAVASSVPHSASIVSNPGASPDGSKIAYVVHWPAAAVIEVANRDGSQRRSLTLFDSDADQPAWSPDGTRMAFRRRLPGAGTDIWVMDAADGGNAVNLTASHGATNQSSPTWSPRQPDGRYRIAYSHAEGGVGQIWSMFADGTDKQAITTSTTVYDDFPSWSPDGTRIAFVRSGTGIFGDLYVVAAGGGSGGLLMQLAGPLAGPQLAPAWSPDGRLLAFVSRHAGDHYQVYTVWADGTRLAQRTADVGDHDYPDWLSKVMVNGTAKM